MQKFSACKNRDWLIHFFFSTSSVCMIAICPVGPPNEMKPSFNQNRNASVNVGARGCSTSRLDTIFTGMRLELARQGRGRQNRCRQFSRAYGRSEQWQELVR